jgi:Tol biopolymer transport system component
MRRLLLALAACLAAPPTALRAQSMEPYVPVRPAADWRTLETAHFVFHYPRELDAWTRDVASHIESQRESVRRLVGWAPPQRVTVLVADPYNQANGSAYPFLRAPAMFLWPVPDDPRDMVGTTRPWGELLSVHEFAHVAHLTRPSRNPLRGRLALLLPTNIGPIGLKTPRWVWEGYATYVEGALTGGGRPYGAWRPAVLREWALEGRLPSYAQISGTSGFAGGSFAYLAGSAFFEWLVRQRGDSSLPAVWRRLTARTPRSFDAAFAGVFPGSPAELYARWSAEVTAEAVAAERALRSTGLVEGTLVQRLRGATGDPTVSRDGERVALVLRTPGRASRVVVWRTGPEPRDSVSVRAARERARAQQRARARDPEDVPAVPYLPALKRALATLWSRDGRAFRNPRWLPGHTRLLVERDEPRADGTFRPDLWLWDSERGSVRRVTRGAGVRDADPSPDGLTALGTRCERGWCDVVRVDLANGGVTVVAEGSPARTFARPRWAPDGRTFAVAAQEAGPWHVLLGRADVRDAALAAVGPNDGRSRFEPTFLPDGRALLVTSDVGGVPNVERLDLASGTATTLTRVTGAAMAPEPIAKANALYFLALRSTGFDLRRLALDSAAAAATPVALVGTSQTAAPRVAIGPGADAAAGAVVLRHPTAAPDTFRTSPTGEPHAYGLGPQHLSLLPGGAWTADGNSVLGVLAGADPVGRLTWVLLGSAGAPSTWRGGSLSAGLRALPVTIDAQLFGAAQRLGVTSGASTPFDTTRADVRYRGGVLALAPRAVLGPASVAARLGGSLGALRDDSAASPRSLAFAELRAGLVRGRGDVSLSLSAAVQGAAGRSDDRDFSRLIGSAAVALRTPLAALRASGASGRVSADAAPFERFLVGGPEPAFLDAAVLGQRVAMPALPTGTLAGRRVELARVTLERGFFQPYAWAARAPDVSSRWLRVAGAEATFATGPVPFARAPGVRIVGGAGYVFDGPTRRRVQAYASVAVRP